MKKIQNSFLKRGSYHFMILVLIPVTWFIHSCDESQHTSSPADARIILEAHISHGIGYSPFDSPLVSDSIAADMVVRARECLSQEELVSPYGNGIESDDLLRRLQSDGLVNMDDDQVCTSFPILLNDARHRYAAMTSEIAGDAVLEIESELNEILGMTRARGWEEWQFHFVWSQLFDSQFVWTEMMKRELVPPLGELIAWVIYPDHPLRTGTNYFPDTELRDYWIMVTWRPSGANTVALVGSVWDLIYRVAVEGDILTSEERASLSELDLLDDKGRPNIPVLHDGDPLLDLLQSTANRYVSFLEDRVPLQELVQLTGSDNKQTFAMAYHDISWEMVDLLLRSNKIDIPSALESGAPASMRSMKGAAAITPVYPPFVELILDAIESQ